ncbi:cell division protein FtsQ/DivIB [Caproiciproducens sp. MSJ-32]|uniref:cell division protein FtsQ/DivIB n=1 Tax=Caproiciproducens sp. MSJ-32 TaxID=2841527 RepID=UPI001C100E18|nr:FtsQ-type POTRA domain-containing protein [Caproiciproducens sp. MSJ-32]MBU5454608.1 FtsQ-type POTRA domain-containing protein [Caproiciproducens sp. MSJ-32]
MSNSSSFIKKRRRKKLIKKFTLGFLVIVVGIIIFIYKAPIFNLKDIKVNGLVTLTKETIQEMLKYEIGQNIFTINYKEMENTLKENPYIKSVKITKNGINSLDIKIEENKIGFYSLRDNTIFTINNEGIIVEELTTIEDKNLIKIEGIDLTNKSIGQKILDDKNVSLILDEFYRMEEVIREYYQISKLNLENINNISCYIEDIKIILGNKNNLQEKMNLALNIIEQEFTEKGYSKGYIDLSFEGNPVMKVEK